MLWLVPFVLAHPFTGKGGAGEPGASIVGQRLAVRVDTDHVTVEYIAEVPAMRVYKEAKAEGADATYATKKLEELRGNVHATWQDTPLPLTSVTLADPARAGEGGFLEFHVKGEAPISGAGTLHVRNGNFPDENAYFMSDVTLGPGVVVEASSLLQVRSGLPRENKHGAWVREESARELSMTVRPAKLWEIATGDGKLPVRTVGLLAERRWIFGLPALLLLPLGFVVWRLRR